MGTDLLVDTSAWVAILLEEPGHQYLIDRLAEASAVWIAAPALSEALIVLERRGVPDGALGLERLLRVSDARVLPFDEAQARAAHAAYARFGKGRHPAALNFGDCLVYAAAQSQNARLLYVGEDFARTDLA